MKKYKNISLSLGFYILAFVWYGFFVYLIGPYWWTLFPTPESSVIVHTQVCLCFLPSLVMIVLGIFFAFKSKTLKESSCLGVFLAVIGLLILVFGLFFFAFFFMWSTISG